MWWIGDIYAASYGPKRGQRLEPFKTLQSRGILWSSGSDYFVTPVAARYGLWASAARQTVKGTYGLHPFGMAEAVDIHTRPPQLYRLGLAADVPGKENCQRAEMPDDVARWGGGLHIARFTRDSRGPLSQAQGLGCECGVGIRSIELRMAQIALGACKPDGRSDMICSYSAGRLGRMSAPKSYTPDWPRRALFF
jgi:hypothetical protein